MDAVLTIEGEALKLATELARLQNRPIDATLTDMPRERLERDRREVEREARIERLRAIGAGIRAHLVEPATSDDTDELCYGDGLH